MLGAGHLLSKYCRDSPIVARRVRLHALLTAFRGEVDNQQDDAHEG
jgi:hypothetical protein